MAMFVSRSVHGQILFSREALATATAYTQKIWPTVSWREIRESRGFAPPYSAVPDVAAASFNRTWNGLLASPI